MIQGVDLSQIRDTFRTVSSVQATAGVHWLTGSTPADPMAVQHVMGHLGPPERPGGYGHPWKRVHESGAAVYCGSEVSGQPVVINAPGEVCETWAGDLANWFVDLDVRITRVDIAMDVQPPELARRRLTYMHRAWRRGEVNTRIRRDSCTLIRSEGEGEGWTLYLGRPQSELMVRAYDRRGPLRIETQWRPQGEVRGIVAEMLVKRGPAHMWRRCASRVSLKLDWYQQLLAGDVEDMPSAQRVDSILEDAKYQLWHQQGLTIWMLGIMGETLASLQRVPDTPLTGPQVRKFRSWLDAHERAGNNVAEARRELEKRCPK